MRQDGSADGPKGPQRKTKERPSFDPRDGVWIALAALIGVGGGHRLYRAYQARRIVNRLTATEPSIADIRASAAFGRAGIMELFRLLTAGPTEPIRRAAGEALAELWRRDELVAEEEKAVVVRGFEVKWSMRRRYPRAMKAPIQARVGFGLPFLNAEGPGISPDQLLWSHRITGASRASLEAFSAWTPGPREIAFELEPGDFSGRGPHRLVLEVRARTSHPDTEVVAAAPPRTSSTTKDEIAAAAAVDRTRSPWEVALPHVPFTFEFDADLRPESLLTLPDEDRGAAITRLVRLRAPDPGPNDDARFIALSGHLALAGPPDVVVTRPPCDLAHQAFVEFEGVPGRFPAGHVVALKGLEARSRLQFGSIPIEAPGEYRMRLALEPDPHLGWANPEVRSVWPTTIATEWVSVRVLRQ